MTATPQKKQSHLILKSLKSLSLIHDFNCEISSIKHPSLAGPSDMAFANDENLLFLALQNQVCCVVILEKMKPLLTKFDTTRTAVFSTQQMSWAMSEVLALFDAHPLRTKTFRHPTSVVSEKVKIGKNVHIGPFVVIEDNVIIGDDVVLESHIYIAAFSEIGARTVIYPFTTIGKPGFGFHTSQKFEHTRIPQIGKVVIGEDCEIGAHCAIDRAAFAETRIGRGCKFDNFCHVAHNCEIGENSIITAGFIIAGSSKIGKNFMAAGGVHVNTHVTVADNVICSGRTGVASHIDQPGMYGGYPAIPMKDSLKVMSSLIHLPKIRKQLASLYKHLNLEQKND